VTAARTLVLVLNPHSGRGRSVEVAWRAEEALRRAGLAFETHRTAARGDAIAIAREAAPRASAVVAIGGDGTFHEVVNGVAEAAGVSSTSTSTSTKGEWAAVASIPVGTGNDFVKSLGMTSDADAAIAVVLAGKRRRIDLGRFRLDGGPWRAFANQIQIGYGARVVHDMASPRSLARRVFPGHLAYMAGGLARLFFHGTDMAVTADGEERRARFFEVHIANGKFCGGGISYAPSASLDDGLLDLTTIEDASTPRLFALMLEVRKARPIAGPGIAVGRARRIAVSAQKGFPLSVDGETYDATGGRLEVEVAAGAVEVLAP
jgi:YegS/Rv2252/BmrU family lipid kinase